ncbi:MAG: isoprenylcysteine carboxylmethyltransferase family protein [Myxococcota bacterium]|nr:isoprenylcysteine carboxylmethyltransferase family protein [Myxococcota bacterium]
MRHPQSTRWPGSRIALSGGTKRIWLILEQPPAYTFVKEFYRLTRTMRALELKIPPPLLTALFALVMWGISFITPLVDYPRYTQLLLSVAFAGLGLCIILAGGWDFKKASTTVNPLKPQNSSTLVQSGLYAFSRDPMYLGLSLGLFGWSLYLSAPLSLLGIAGFMFAITRLQIIPEERALEERFGEEFSAYQTKVRRWL